MSPHIGPRANLTGAVWLRRIHFLSAYPSTAAIFMAGSRVPREGQRLVQSDLARSFQLIPSKGARAGYYEGPIAKSLSAALQKQESPLREDDFAAFKAEWVEPITSTYR